MPSVTSQGSPFGGYGPWVVLATAWLLSLVTAAISILPASLLVLIMDDLTIGSTAASWLISATLLLPALISIPIGVGMDRISDHAVMLAGTIAILVLSAAGWWLALTAAYWPLVATRVLIGAGIVAIWIGSANVVGATFTEKARATALAIFTTSAPAGYAIGQYFPPRIAGLFGWEVNFLIFGIGSVVAFGGFSVTHRRVTRVDTRADTPTLRDFKRLFSIRGTWLVCGLAFVGYSLHLLFNSWMPTYLTTEIGLSLANSALFVAVFPAMGVLSRISGGILSDRVFNHRRRPIPLISFVITVPIIAVIAVTTDAFLLLILLILAGYFIQLSIGVLYAYIRELVSTDIAGSATAFLSSVAFTGAFIAPLAAGAVLDYTKSYRIVFTLAGALTVAGIVIAWFSPRDTTRAHRIQ